jgi:hypothetical protein
LATFGTALDAWPRVTDLDETTREGYETYIRGYIRPALDTGGTGKYEGVQGQLTETGSQGDDNLISLHVIYPEQT